LAPGDDVVAVYQRIMRIVFDRLSPTFGQRTIAAIAKNVIARQSKKHPILKYLTVSEQGMEWAQFEAHLDEVTDHEISKALEDFLDEFFGAVSNLIGRLVVGKIFKEAEELAKRGGDE
jgi:hypothetical protein